MDVEVSAPLSGGRIRDPTESTIRQLFASQVKCARPGCERPLVALDVHGNRTIVADIAHILAASPDGPRPWSRADHSEEEIRGFDNLVLLCKEHHRVVDLHWTDYPAEMLRAWKSTAACDGTGLELSPSDITAVLKRLEAYLGSGVGGRVLSLGPAEIQIERLMNDYRFVAGREQHLNALDAFLDQADLSYLLIHERFGRGKTALLVEWVRRMRATGTREVVFVPISQRYGTADLGTALGQLAYELAAPA